MGRRPCLEEGCAKQVAYGGTQHCIGHGGGRRCQTANCSKSAVGDTGHCKAHGGGRRCQHGGCSKAAVAGGTPCSSRTAGTGGARRRAAPSLPQTTRCTALRMGAANGASMRAAARQSLKLPAVCTAGYVSSASSPTMRRTMHINSAVRPRRPKPRAGPRSWCEDSGGGWRVRGHPQASSRSDVLRQFIGMFFNIIRRRAHNPLGRERERERERESGK